MKPVQGVRRPPYPSFRRQRQQRAEVLLLKAVGLRVFLLIINLVAAKDG